MPAQYAYAADFDIASGSLPAADEARMNGLLELGARECDDESGIAPGQWAPLENATFVFDAPEGCADILHLRDERWRQYLLRTVPADKIEVDADLDGVYEYAWDLADAWVEGYPLNEAANGAPFTALRLRPIASAPITAWRGRVRITGDWGYETILSQVKQCSIVKAHGLSQHLYAGELVQETLKQAAGDVRIPHRLYALPVIA